MLKSEKGFDNIFTDVLNIISFSSSVGRFPIHPRKTEPF